MNTAVKEVQVIKATKIGEKTEKIRVAAYCRVSTDKDDQLNSFFAQMRYYRDYVRGNDKMVLVDIYADEGITGTELAKRDEMKRLIRDCKHKKIDRVLVKSVTRFARNSLECIETIRTMQSCGVSVLFENDHIDTETMNSEMMLYIKSAFAQSEATSASKRMSTSIRMKMEDGTYVATSAPFGYRLVDGEYAVVPEEAEVVRKIFALYLQGYGVNVIAKTIRDTDGDKRVWNRQGIKYILTNEKYIGDTMWQKSFTPAVLPLRNRPNRGELPKYYCEGTQEAIVSKEDFIAVKNLMREREEKHYKQYRNEKKLFYRKIMCRHCGWSYRVKQIQNGYVWACSRKGMIGGECSSRSYTDTELYRSFIKVYNILKQNKRVLLDETISQLQTLKVKANCGNNVIAEIDEKIAMLGRQNNLYGQMLANGVIDEVTYHEKADSLKGQITELRSRRMKIINDDDEETCIEQLRQLRKIIEESPDYLDEMDTELFGKIVKLIYAEEDGALSFVIKGDLELKVYVGGENDEQND